MDDDFRKQKEIEFKNEYERLFANNTPVKQKAAPDAENEEWSTEQLLDE